MIRFASDATPELNLGGYWTLAVVWVYPLFLSFEINRKDFYIPFCLRDREQEYKILGKGFHENLFSALFRVVTDVVDTIANFILIGSIPLFFISNAMAGTSGDVFLCTFAYTVLKVMFIMMVISRLDKRVARIAEDILKNGTPEQKFETANRLRKTREELIKQLYKSAAADGYEPAKKQLDLRGWIDYGTPQNP